MILRLKKGIRPEDLGFKKDNLMFSKNSNFMYTYEYLILDPETYELYIDTGSDGLTGNKELIKLFDLFNLGYVELVSGNDNEKVVDDYCINDYYTTQQLIRREQRNREVYLPAVDSETEEKIDIFNHNIKERLEAIIQQKQDNGIFVPNLDEISGELHIENINQNNRYYESISCDGPICDWDSNERLECWTRDGEDMYKGNR